MRRNSVLGRANSCAMALRSVRIWALGSRKQISMVRESGEMRSENWARQTIRGCKQWGAPGERTEVQRGKRKGPQMGKIREKPRTEPESCLCCSLGPDGCAFKCTVELVAGRHCRVGAGLFLPSSLLYLIWPSFVASQADTADGSPWGFHGKTERKWFQNPADLNFHPTSTTSNVHGLDKVGSPLCSSIFSSKMGHNNSKYFGEE